MRVKTFLFSIIFCSYLFIVCFYLIFQRYDKSETQYLIEAESPTAFIIRKAVQSVELRIETPQARHEYVLTTSNQTLTLKKENSQSTIRADQCSSYTTVTNPWTMKALNRVQESKMMSDAQITQKVNLNTSFSYFLSSLL